MCSATDDPTTYDAPEPVRPRTYRLSGDAPVAPAEPRHGSVALAVLGELLNDAEAALEKYPTSTGRLMEVLTLRSARDAVAVAESKL